MAGNAIELATAYVSLSVEASNVGKEVAAKVGAPVEEEADRAGLSAGKKLGAGLLVGLGAAAAAGKALYEIGGVFDDVSDTIRVGTGATGDALAALEQSAKTVGTSIPASFEDVGTTIADVNTRLGLTGPTLEKFASQVLEAGRLSGTAIDVNKMSGAFNAFKIEGESTTEAMDHLFRVSQATGIGMNELASNVVSNAPAVQALGFTFEETASLVGNLDKAGLNSSKMMMGMGKALVELAKDGEEPQEAFKRVTGEIDGFLKAGDKASAIEMASKLFGTRNATQFIGALESGALAMDDLSAVAGMTNDTILGAADETNDFAESWLMFKNKALVAIEPVATRVFNLIGDGMAWINDNAVPAIERFIQGWKDGEGAGGRLRDVVEGVVDKVKALAGWLKDNEAAVKLVAAAVGGAAIGWGLYTAATKAWETATKIATAVQKAFNAVLKANPIGLIITAIMALVGVMIYLYNNNETVKNAIDKAWAFIKGAIDAVVTWFKDTAWPWIRDVFDRIATGASRLWNDWIKPAWENIKRGIETVVTWLRDTAWPWIKDVWDKIATGVKWLWENAIKPAWENIKRGIEITVGWFKDTAWPWMRDAMDSIGRGASVLWNDWIKPAFNSIKEGVGKVVEAFGAAKEGIGRAWSNLKDAVAGPIEAAMDFVNKYFIDPVNSLLDKLGLSFKIPRINTGGGGGAKGVATKGGPLAAYAGGGEIQGPWRGPRADNVLGVTNAGVPIARVNPREYILPVRATDRLRRMVGNGGLEMLRRGMLPGYAGGGFVSDAWGWLKQKGSDAIDWASNIARVLKNPGKALAEFVGNALKGIGSGPFAQAMVSVAKKVAEGVAAKIASFVDVGGGAGTATGSMPWQQIWAMVQAVAPEARLSPGTVRPPGTRTASGAISLHSQGRAIDITSGNMMATFNKIRPLRAWTELYYSPAGARQMLRGASHIPQGITRANHFDHIHAGMARGGLVRPFVADSGVTLAPGLNLLNNKTGKPEPLARTDQRMRLHPDDIRAVAAAVERGANRGISEVGRGLWR